MVQHNFAVTTHLFGILIGKNTIGIFIYFPISLKILFLFPSTQNCATIKKKASKERQ